jgi:hypothetical protein
LDSDESKDTLEAWETVDSKIGIEIDQSKGLKQSKRDLITAKQSRTRMNQRMRAPETPNEVETEDTGKGKKEKVGTGEGRGDGLGVGG